MKILHLLGLIFCLNFCALAHGAQDASVTVANSAIRERPTQDAKVIETKTAGAKIRISSFNKDGWYKIRTSTGQFGWIWQADLEISSFNNDVKAANIDIKEKPHERRGNRRLPWLFLKGGLNLFPILSSDVSSKLGLSSSHMYLATGGFGELQFQVQEKLRAGLRIATFSGSGSATAGGNTYSVTLSSTPILAGVEAEVSQGENFELGVGTYLGFGVGNSLTVNASSLPTPNSFTLEKSYLAAELNVSMRYAFLRWMSGVFETGLFYTQIPQTATTVIAHDTVFSDGVSVPAQLKVPMVGLIFSAGLQFAY